MACRKLVYNVGLILLISINLLVFNIMMMICLMFVVTVTVIVIVRVIVRVIVIVIVIGKLMASWGLLISYYCLLLIKNKRKSWKL